MFRLDTRVASFFALSLLAALGTFFILYATPEGLGLSDDSIAYIAGARSILSGQGYREAWLASNGPVTHFPPGFSSLLTLVGVSGLDPLRGTRFVNSLLFGANTFLLGLLGWQMTKSWAAGILLALLFLTNASLLRAHAVAMSEPLYIFLSLAAFLTFSFAMQEPNGTQIPKGDAVNADTADSKAENQRLSASRKNLTWLILTGIFTAFAYLTRYAGLALFATFFVALVLLHDTWKKRLTNAGIFIASFLPWTLGWSIRNKLVADNATNRTLVYHPLSAENLETGIYNISEFLVPVEAWRRAVIKVPNLILIIVSLIGLAILIWLLYRGLKKFLQPLTERPEILSYTSGLYIFGYLASIISSMILFDASTKFKLRILSPIYVSLLVLLVYLGYWLWQKRALIWRGLVLVLSSFIFLLSSFETYSVMTQLQKGGQGYASFQWYDSEAMAFLSGLPDGTRIYTNQSGPVYLYTDRPNYVLPDLVDPVTGLPRGDYEQGLKLLQQDVLSGKAVLALFKFGSESEDVQTIYLQLADGLYLAHDSHGDKVYTAHP